MTEHLKKQIEDAASDVRAAKRNWREADGKIDSIQSMISSTKSSIESAEASIVAMQANIENATRSLFEALSERADANEKFKVAEARLGFFNRELIDHPYAGSF